MTTHEIGNLRFLIEHQLGVISTLERQGLDLHDASDLLGRLMRRDEDIRRRMTGAPQVVAIDEAGSRPRERMELRFVPDGLPIACRPAVPAV